MSIDVDELGSVRAELHSVEVALQAVGSQFEALGRGLMVLGDQLKNLLDAHKAVNSRLERLERQHHHYQQN